MKRKGEENKSSKALLYSILAIGTLIIIGTSITGNSIFDWFFAKPAETNNNEPSTDETNNEANPSGTETALQTDYWIDCGESRVHPFVTRKDHTSGGIGEASTAAEALQKAKEACLDNLHSNMVNLADEREPDLPVHKCRDNLCPLTGTTNEQGKEQRQGCEIKTQWSRDYGMIEEVIFTNPWTGPWGNGHQATIDCELKAGAFVVAENTCGECGTGAPWPQ